MLAAAAPVEYVACVELHYRYSSKSSKCSCKSKECCLCGGTDDFDFVQSFACFELCFCVYEFKVVEQRYSDLVVQVTPFSSRFSLPSPLPAAATAAAKAAARSNPRTVANAASSTRKGGLASLGSRIPWAIAGTSSSKCCSSTAASHTGIARSTALAAVDATTQQTRGGVGSAGSEVACTLATAAAAGGGFRCHHGVRPPPASHAAIASGASTA